MTKLSAFFIPVLAISLFLSEQPVKVDAANPGEMLPQGRGLHDGGLSMRDLWEDPWSLTRRMPSIMDWMQRTSTFHMKEIDNEFIAFVDCPGFKREDINVSLEGNNYLTVTARKHCSEKDKFCINRDVFQQFRVGEEVNTENISVYLEDGVLRVHLPKTGSKKSRFFNIQMPHLFGPSETGESIPVSHPHPSPRAPQESVTGKMKSYYDDMKHRGQQTYENVKTGADDSYASVKDSAGQTYDQAKNRAGGMYDTASKQAGAIFESMQEGAENAYEGAKGGAKSAYEEAQERARAASEKVKDTTEDVKEGARGTAQKVKETMGGIKEGVKEAAWRAKEDTKESYEDVKEGAKEGYERGQEAGEVTFAEKVKRGFESVKERVIGKTEL